MIKDKDVDATNFEGDVSIGHDVAIGGNIVLQGKAYLKGSVKIDGWLDAPNIKTVNKGLFLTLDSLQSEYPEPIQGWWAVVGDLANGYIYAVNNGKWVKTSTKFTEIVNLEIDLSNYVEFFNKELKVAELQGFRADDDLIYALPGSSLISSEDYDKVLATTSDLKSKQDILKSQENIKTINGQSILGEGDLQIGSGEFTWIDVP